uniref:Unkown protein n=1 Tax=Riptortus pedestris TaxID=329032 RepID=R4WTQ4_RIPPE|nr:unkown protein [Riptortus pedestris]
MSKHHLSKANDLHNHKQDSKDFYISFSYNRPPETDASHSLSKIRIKKKNKNCHNTSLSSEIPCLLFFNSFAHSCPRYFENLSS